MRTVLVVWALLLLAVPGFAADPDIPAANRVVIKTQLDEMNHGDCKTALGLYTPDTRNFGRKVGKAVMAQIFRDIYPTFPDFQQKIVDMVASGDSVIVREKMSGTHDGMDVHLDVDRSKDHLLIASSHRERAVPPLDCSVGNPFGRSVNPWNAVAMATRHYSASAFRDMPPSTTSVT